MTEPHHFRKELRSSYDQFLGEQQACFPESETIKIDIHCHDHNSDIPDELWGRILRVRESWLTTEDLLSCLRDHGADLVTVTNHNNARSCWELLDKGMDVLVGGEFTCAFPEMDIAFHVLAYGFTPEQEVELCKRRKNIYEFQAYTAANRIPTVLPHPLYFYNPRGWTDLGLFEKFALLFERFEVLNGQRDLWQNSLAREWVRSLDEERLRAYSKKHGIDPSGFCHHPYRRFMTGGSDDHMGTFAGSCGTLLHIPDLQKEREIHKLSTLALEALREGRTSVYGRVGEAEKLTVSLLGYFCQVVLNMKDPGLVRMFLHRGGLQDKMGCLLVSNVLQELKRHRYTMRFFKKFHQALYGKRPGLLTNMMVSRDFKPLMAELNHIASAKREGAEAYHEALVNTAPRLFRHLTLLLEKRVAEKLRDRRFESLFFSQSTDELVRKFELPSHLRTLFSGEKSDRGQDMTHINLPEILDKLSFPALASLVVAGASFASNKALYNKRPIFEEISRNLNRFQHPRRALWLTDSLFDQNGVSTVLRDTLEEVRDKNLPIDFLIASNEADPGDHLVVVKSLGQFSAPQFGDQVLHIPDLMEVQKRFEEGAYDRVICSTELMMGAVALYLKHTFNIPAWFYLHTDWMEFIEKNTELNRHALDRVRRVLRAFYRQFEGIFVLNGEHRDWLAGSAMGIAPERILPTAHWPGSQFKPDPAPKPEIFETVANGDPVLLYAGRVSEEKGVMELPEILALVRASIPRARLAIAGRGPAEERLRQAVPDARFLGWLEPDRLRTAYSSADLLVLPSRFDTFGRVVIEAMSCALPVAAYDAKGPKDIIVDGLNGLLASTSKDLARGIARYLSQEETHAAFRRSALFRSTQYQPAAIMSRFLRDIGCESPYKNVAGANLKTNGETSRPASASADKGGGFLSDLLEIVQVS